MDLDCPRVYIGECRCQRGAYLIASEDSAFYPKAGMYRMGRYMFKVRMQMHMGEHFWHWLVHKPPGVRSVVAFPHTEYHNYTIAMILDPFPCSTSGTFRTVMMNVDTLILGISIPVLVWRIQRAIRRFLRERLDAKLLALAMASHARLGVGSPWLPTDLWAKIAGCARNNNQRGPDTH